VKSVVPRARAAVLRTLLLLLIAMGLIAGFIGCVQRKMIYHPQRYEQRLLDSLPDRLVRVPYTVEGREQVAFYLPPRTASDDKPTRTWVLFHGNASLALWWMRWIEEDVNVDDVAWLLVDYPGYGMNDGKPTRASIVMATESVIPALATVIDTPREDIESDLSTLGFSMGAAAAAEFAVRHPVKNVVMLAPFTSLGAMARRTVGWPLSEVLIDRFDNTKRLEQLSARSTPPRVVILHGDRDTVVPFSQGRRLAEQFPEMVRFVPVAGADHVDILDSTASQLREILIHEQAPAVP
jgi:pimeloyl-ACP methyl ester carboxylesterase